ncbi:MAG: HAD family hydrolase [Bacilli bacterium]
MKKLPNAIIFDLDGTLLNTLEDLTDAVNATLINFHFPPRTIDEVRTFVGNGLDVLVQRILPLKVDLMIYQNCLDYFKKYYQEHLLIKTKPYEGINVLLEELQRLHIKMAIVSNKIQSGVTELKQLFFSNWVDVAIGDQLGLALKPHPDSVLKAIADLGLSQTDFIIYVGDSETDIQTAKNAKLPFIGVTWGFRTKDQLIKAGAINLIDEPYELIRYFQS